MTDETPDLSDRIAIAREEVAQLLINLPYTFDLDDLPNGDRLHELEWLTALVVWLREFEGALLTQQLAASEMLAEMQQLRGERKIVRQFFGTV